MMSMSTPISKIRVSRLSIVTLEGSKSLLGDLAKKSMEVSEIPIIMSILGRRHS